MKRHKHNLSHFRLSSCHMGQLLPIGCVEVLPGDTFQHNTSVMVRATPLVRPLMHPCQVRVHHWFVPNRLLWSDWEDFITGGADPDNPPTFPTVVIGDAEAGTIVDYLGVTPPPLITDAMEISELPIRAYNKIYNEFYRDQDLQSEVAEDSLVVQRVAWNKDYYTTARPTPQKGDVVGVPLTVTDPSAGVNHFELRNAGGTAIRPVQMVNGSVNVQWSSDPGASGQTFFNQSPNLSLSIRDLRETAALQRYAENRSRYGSRYTEYLRFLGVKSGDARLQRPEYLGGGKGNISFSEVLQTALGAGGDGVGDMAGHGIGGLRSRTYRRFFPEHGFVISLMSIVPRSVYGNVTPRHWFRTTREDFYQKELEHIGQQEVLAKELYAQDDATGSAVFGYQDRYAEYRHEPSTVQTSFRNHPTYALQFAEWHLGRILSASPTLNSSFITCTPQETRVFQDTSGDDTILFMCSHHLVARRLVSGRKGGRII